jgi:hypothetical protein
VRERPVSFGGGGSLLGVVSEPEERDAQSSRDVPGVIVLNAGLLHKVGPYRLSVDLARAIALKSHHVLRFDLSGIGDSRMVASSRPARERAVGDVRRAMDFMAGEYGLNQFVLAGLCSGSDNSHYASLQDDRVVGTAHLDGYAIRNLKYYVKYFGGRLLSWRFLRTKLRRRENEEVARGRSPAVAARTREFPSKDELTRDFAKLVDRRVRLLYVYTGESESYNYKGQLRAVISGVKFGELLEEEFFPLASHTYIGLESRRKAVECVAAWLGRHWPSHASGDTQVRPQVSA